jgi:hypothetical protein
MVDITSEYKWEKGKKVLEIEELNMVIATMHLGEDSLSIEDFINMPRKQHVFISLIATIKSLPNGILVCLPLNLLIHYQFKTSSTCQGKMMCLSH